MMNRKRTLLSAAIVLLAGVCGGCAAPLGEPLPSAKPFSTAGLCEQAGQPLVIPEAIAATLADDSGADGDALADALLQKASLEVVHYAADQSVCEAIFDQGRATFAAALERNQLALRKVGGYRAAKDPGIASVQAQITQLWREDQSARGAYIGAKTDDDRGVAFWAQRLATAHASRVDEKSTRYMRNLLQDIDWVDQDRYGKDVSAHAWILVQHADDHVGLQQLALDRMTPFLASGGIKPANYAYLWDRVAVNTGKLQRYGTQPTWECSDSGQLTLQPMEDPEGVNARRAEMGLNTVEEGLSSMAASVCF
ncbi:MAG: DUF6624 domain-containing protein [Pseudomonadota bacterium]